MIRFHPSNESDIDRIQEWTNLDTYHKGQNNPSWWLTGNGLLSFCLFDEQGPVFYVRLDDGDLIRLSVQFAPLSVVPKKRLVRAMIQTLPKLINVAKSYGKKGMIFSSESPSLILFMQRAGFRCSDDGDFVLPFGE
jgi:hypothetical protein